MADARTATANRAGGTMFNQAFSWLGWPETRHGPSTLGAWSGYRIGAVILALSLLVADHALALGLRRRSSAFNGSTESAPQSFLRVDLAAGMGLLAVVCLIVAAQGRRNPAAWLREVVAGPHTILLSLALFTLPLSLRANNVSSSLESSRWLIAYWLVTFALVVLLRSERRDVRVKTSIVVVAVLLLGIAARLALWLVRLRYFPEVPAELGPPYLTRIPRIFRSDGLSVNTVGTIAVFAAWMCVDRARITARGSLAVALLWTVGAALASVALMVSNSRVSFGVLLVAAGLAAAAAFRRDGLNLWILIGGVAIAIAIVRFAFWEQIDASPVRWVGGRGRIWKAAVNAWFDEPILGHGLGVNERNALTPYRPANHAHNTFLSSLVAVGPVGLALSLWAMGSLGRQVWQQRSAFLGTTMVFLFAVTVASSLVYNGFVLPAVQWRNTLVVVLIAFTAAGGWKSLPQTMPKPPQRPVPAQPQNRPPNVRANDAGPSAAGPRHKSPTKSTSFSDLVG